MSFFFLTEPSNPRFSGSARFALASKTAFHKLVPTLRQVLGLRLLHALPVAMKRSFRLLSLIRQGLLTALTFHDVTADAEFYGRLSTLLE